jgi:hypothetical protein
MARLGCFIHRWLPSQSLLQSNEFRKNPAVFGHTFCLGVLGMGLVQPRMDLVAHLNHPLFGV